jgi:hypothetical protein
MAAEITALIGLVVNIVFVIPFAIFVSLKPGRTAIRLYTCIIAILTKFENQVFYTLNAVFPILAAVEALDASVYEPLEMGRVVEEGADGSTMPNAKYARRPFAVSSSIRSMTRLLVSSRKCFSLFRGYGWLLLWNLAKCLALLSTIKLPSALGVMVQIFLPLALLQLHILWVHTVISSSNSKPFWKRTVPAGRALKAVALPMLLLQVAEVVVQRTLLHAYRAAGAKWEDFFPLGNMNKGLGIWLLLIALVVFLILPLNLLLVRVEASLLPTDVPTIVPLDPAFAIGQHKRGYITIIEAWTSFQQTARVNLAFLYVKAILFTAFCVAVIGFIDFWWYIFVAFSNWRF